MHDKSDNIAVKPCYSTCIVLLSYISGTEPPWATAPRTPASQIAISRPPKPDIKGGRLQVPLYM